MNVPRAFLAAVGAFWSELIPAPSHAPSLWDYEGAALADREAGVDVWEPSHADYDDDPFVSDSYLRYNDADPAEVSAGVQTTAPSAGLPFTFNAGELVATARGLIYNHYQFADVERVGELHLAHGAAELVVSQLVADLTAAYTEAQK